MDSETALRNLPPRLQSGLRRAFQEGGEMAVEMLARDEMPPERALMAGLALDPVGRPLFENSIDDYASAYQDLPEFTPEVIIGGGAHAATYAAVRTQLYGNFPLVLEKEPRFGGTFAMTQNSSFFLNSRNRPGPQGGAGSRDALNVIPGAPMQPSDMSGSEYQANADLGLVVRCTLALNARVRRATVTEIARDGNGLMVVTDRGVVATRRVIVATGLGPRAQFTTVMDDDERVLSFEQFMRRFDRMTFPLKDLGRVAVVGKGDSGKTAIEALTGYGPNMNGSVASLDYIPRIDWWGVGGAMTKEIWLRDNRTRYKPIGALFRCQNQETPNARVRGLPKLNKLLKTYDGVQVDGETYDTVIQCLNFVTPWDSQIRAPELGGGVTVRFRSGSEVDKEDRGVTVAVADPRKQLFVVGPAADIEFEEGIDPDTIRNAQNKIALFRLAPRTATLARLLPEV